MTSWAANLARTARQWCVVARIEGVGRAGSATEAVTDGVDGVYRFCSAVPAYAGTTDEPAALWLPLLMDSLPDVLSERLSLQGGVADDQASVALSIVDHDDVLTSVVQPDAAPVALMAGCTATATTIFAMSTSDAGAFDAGEVLYLDGEAIYVTARPGSSGSSSLDVLRGYLGTAAAPHEEGARAYAALPLLGGLRMTVSLAPLDGGSSADERVLGRYVIDSVSWDEGLNAWQVGGRAEVEQLAAVVPVEPWVASISATGDRASGRVLIDTTDREFEDDSFGSHVSLLIGSEVLSGTQALGTTVTVEAPGRGTAGTKVAEVPLHGTARRVLTAEDFRRSPGPTPSTSRSSGTWVQDTHPLTIALCILTSSRVAEDGLELVNYESGGTNYSSLPVGYGAGVLAADIDWDAWDAVRARLEGFELGNVVLGADSRTVREILDEEILKPLGVHLITVGGQLRPVLSRAPVVGEAATTIDDDVLLVVDGRPDLAVSRDLAGAATSVTYELGPQGVAAAASAANPTRSRAGLRVRVRWASDDAGQVHLWQARALVRTRQAYRPRTRLTAGLDASLWDTSVGDRVLVTLPEVPTMAGGRGLSGAVAEVSYREPRLDTERGVWLQEEMTVYPADQVSRRIAPAAWVDSVAASTATVLANRFTEADAAGGLPTTDASAFDVGDVLRLVTSYGIEVTPGNTETVVSISGDDIELTGDFGGDLSTGNVLVFAGHDDATAGQQAGYAWMATDASVVGDSASPPTYYGEP